GSVPAEGAGADPPAPHSPSGSRGSVRNPCECAGTPGHSNRPSPARSPKYRLLSRSGEANAQIVRQRTPTPSRDRNYHCTRSCSNVPWPSSRAMRRLAAIPRLQRVGARSRGRQTGPERVIKATVIVPTDLLSVGGRGNFPAISSGPCNWLRQPVGSRVQAQEANDRTLRLRQLGHHHLGLPLTDSNFVPLDRREHLDQSVRRRTRARPSLRIQRQRPLTRAGHRLAQLPLQQRLHQQGEEVRRQQTLNPRHVLQEHRGHREVGLELGEPLFQQRLAFVRLEHLGGAQLAVIGQQREYAILSLRFRERLQVQLPRQCETRSCLPQILGLLARSAPCCLAERLFLLFLDLNQQPGTRLGLRQNLRQCLFYLGPRAEPGARTLEAFPQVAQRCGRLLDRPGTS